MIALSCKKRSDRFRRANHAGVATRLRRVGLHSETSRHRGGFFVVELTVAAMLLVVMTMAFAQMVVHLHDALELARQKSVALQLVRNIADELQLADEAAIEGPLLADVSLPDWADGQLPFGQVNIQRRPEFTEEGASAFSVSVSWQHEVRHEVAIVVYRWEASR